MRWIVLASKVLVTVVTIVLAVIGLGGVPDDVVTWWSWLETVEGNASGDIGRWLLVISAVVLFLGVNVVPAVVPRATRLVHRNGGSTVLARPAPAQKPYVDWDNVRWTDEGGEDVGGPFCPNDWTRLRYVNSRRITLGERETEEVSNADYVSSYHGYLFCLNCQREFLFEANVKEVYLAREEAAVKLEAMRRQQGGD